MNHLAHLVLAGPNPDDRFGALLGDHVKGRLALERLPPALAGGVRLHRAIDGWTDAHPATRDLLARLTPPWRRYGGVILDVLFDAMLERHWSRFCEISLDQFADDIDRLMREREQEMPPRMRRFTRWARAVGLWRRYGDRQMLDQIFAQLAHRHGRAEPLGSGARLLDRLEPEIERGFLCLFPDLLARSHGFRANTKR